MKHLICSLLVSLLLVPLAWSQTRAIRPVSIQIPSGENVDLYQGSYALVIGVSDYQDNAWVDLDSVGADVEAVRETLEEHGFMVETLMNPTKSGLLNGITDFIDTHGYEQENRLLFYYAGHGHTQERNGRKFGYLVPVDAPSPFENKKAFYRKSLKMEQILSWAKQIESKHALFVFDSCFSGSVLQSRAAIVPEDISFSTLKPVRQFISAGSADQTVPSVSKFRPLFIRGINGKADLDNDGFVTGDELGMYLQKQVPFYEPGQNPQYAKIRDPDLDEGNFVFDARNRGKSESKIVNFYISEDDWLNDSNSDPASWKMIRNSDSDYKYFGEVSSGLPNGQGTLIDEIGNKYVGAFKDGQRSDKGTTFWLSGGQYVGEYKGDNQHGRGTYTHPDGQKYVGDFEDNQMKEGTWTWPDGRKYVGSVSGNGLPNGQGTWTSPEGSKYVGEFVKGEFDGQGTYTHPDLMRYTGDFNNGLPNGQGVWSHPNGEKYVGSFEDGKFNGEGTYAWPDGRKYVGEWMDGKKNGQGVMTYPDGTKYVGAFKDNNRHGQGALTNPDGQTYVGEWKNGKTHEQGPAPHLKDNNYVEEFKDNNRLVQETLTNPDGRVWDGLLKGGAFVVEDEIQPKQSKFGETTLYISEEDWFNYFESNSASWKTSGNPDNESVYVGKVSNGLPNGQGVWSHPNGEKYVGSFEDGKFNGEGTYTWPDGRKYVGEWVGDKREGQGKLTLQDGSNYDGEWWNDKKNGRGIWTYSDRRVKSGIWKDDHFAEESSTKQKLLKSATLTLFIGEGDLRNSRGYSNQAWKIKRIRDTDSMFVGEVINGLPHGQGTVTFSNNAEYVGEFRDGQFNGQGTYTFPDGAKYVGYWLNGLKNGQGTYTFPDGRVKSGLWIFNVFAGQNPLQQEQLELRENTAKRKQLESRIMVLYIGKEDWFRGRESNPAFWETKKNLESDYVYVGAVSKGLPHGQGTLTYPNGRVQKGLWSRGNFLDKNFKGQSTQDKTSAISVEAGQKKLLETRECTDCDLSEANLIHSDLMNAKLVNANLMQADLTRVNLVNANLTKAYMFGAYMFGADLRGALMIGTNLHGAHLNYADLRKAHLREAELSSAILIGANLANTNLYGVDLRDANLDSADLSNANLQNANLQNANLQNANLWNTELSKAMIDQANFCNTTMPDGSINNEDC